MTSTDELAFAPPTAKQLVAEVQATLNSAALVAPGTAAVGCVAHVAPFHTSASVPLPDAPTATQRDTETHDTPSSALWGAGLVVAWVDQFVPLKRSPSVALVLSAAPRR